MIHVVAIITTKPGMRDTVLSHARENLAAVRAEKGCIEYGPVIDAEGFAAGKPLGPDTFMVVEKWDSLDALKAHSVAPHMKAYAEKTREHIANRAVHVLTSAA
jgi:quinol monooxygenase YgiN